MRFHSSTEKHKEYWKDRQIDWKEAYFDTLDHPHRDYLIKILETQPPRSVLEIGCASGPNLYRIKKAFPDCRVCGCDINEEAIKTADFIFRQEWPEKHFEKPAIDSIADIDFRVGGIESVPFHGEYFDLVITDATLIYIDPKTMPRALREMRRLSYDKFLMIEFHSTSWLKRKALNLASGYFAYDYKKLLSEKYFKNIVLTKVPKDMWGGTPWNDFGYFITCVR